VVPRVGEALGQAAGDPLIVLYGPGASDRFIGTDLQERTLEEALLDALRATGYRYVVFSSTNSPWFCLDDESRDFFGSVLSNSEDPGDGLLPSRGERSKLVNRQTSTGNFPKASANPEPGAGQQRPMAATDAVNQDAQRRGRELDREALRLLNACLDIRNTAIAVVIVQAGNFLRFNAAERDLADWFPRWQQAPASDNVCVLVFTERSMEATTEFVRSLGYANVLVSCLERQRARPSGPSSGEIIEPDAAEIERIVQRARLKDSELMSPWRNWLEFDRNIAGIAAQPEVPAYIWSRRLHSLAAAGASLSEAELRRRGWVDSLQSGQSAWERLSELTGLTEVKEHIDRLRWRAEAEAKRRRRGRLRESGSLHLVFTGSPGTGKTTVARLIGELYREMGLLRRGHLHAPEASELIGMYVGHTAVQTNQAVDAALDGVLFIDEAYRLSEAPGGFGQEAIDTLITRMDNERERLVVVVAGYPDKMKTFLRSNPGLPRRFPRGNTIEFPDYEPEALLTILLGMLRDRALTWVPELEPKLKETVERIYKNRDRETFGNAGEMRNLAQEIETNWAKRARADIDALVIPEDVPGIPDGPLVTSDDLSASHREPA
jgi:hypothetical protein